MFIRQQMASSSHDSIGSFPSMHSLAKASPATSFIAETFTTTAEVGMLVRARACVRACVRACMRTCGRACGRAGGRAGRRAGGRTCVVRAHLHVFYNESLAIKM